MNGPTVFMAGGGTGGHVFPMVAVAHALRLLVPEIRPVFVGTSRGMETKFVPEQGFELELLDVLPMRGGGFRGLLKGAFRAGRLLPESRDLIRRYEPRAVFSIGGYAAGPVSLAARTLKIPVALMEPNSVAGLANVLIAPFVQRAYTAFELVERRFSPSVVLRSGVPLRPGFEPAPYAPSSPIRILVLGGSQGAQSLNETLPEALAGVRVPISVTHQCGTSHLEAVTKRYDELGVAFAQVVPFIEDMGAALSGSDLIIGRAGAGAVSEITAVGRPSLLIPYPYASGDHQRLNAESLQKVGAAVCVPSEQATATRILEDINRLVTDRALLFKMAGAASHFGRPRAAEVVARDFLQLAGITANTTSVAPAADERALYQVKETA